MSSSTKLYLVTLLIFILIFIALTVLYSLHIITTKITISIIVGLSISTLNAVIGLINYRIGLNKPDEVFLRRIFGGMVIRLILSLIFIVFALLFLEINRISFIFSALFFYIFYLIIEIVSLNLYKN